MERQPDEDTESGTIINAATMLTRAQLEAEQTTHFTDLQLQLGSGVHRHSRSFSFSPPNGKMLRSWSNII
eukprot:COSAG05_NODE_543_length_8789_cov_7.804603_3_plen_70_part_00